MKHRLLPISCQPSRQQGFTLIELVMVIILIGILSFGAASLFSSRDAYAGFIAKDQLISSALLAQQVALGMSADPTPVSLTVSVNSDGDWVFSLTKVGAAAIVLDQDASGGSLSVNGTVLGSGASRTFTWNSEAALVSGSNHEIRFDAGGVTSRVCLSASGYAYESTGACPS